LIPNNNICQLLVQTKQFGFVESHLFDALQSNIVADALSRLPSSAPTSALDSGDDGTLDALFGAPETFFSTSLVEMSSEFRAKLKQGYERDARWPSVIVALKENEKETLPAKLPYYLDGDLLYLRDVNPTGTPKLCVPESLCT
jgi:hypothetical protein